MKQGNINALVFCPPWRNNDSNHCNSLIKLYVFLYLQAMIIAQAEKINSHVKIIEKMCITIKKLSLSF